MAVTIGMAKNDIRPTQFLQRLIRADFIIGMVQPGHITVLLNTIIHSTKEQQA
jgi:hypothetical protein